MLVFPRFYQPELKVDKMKVDELKTELSQRGLDTSGLKPALGMNLSSVSL